jgi:hypothetical protein
MADFTRNGYGQVEPNQLSAQKTGQIYASLPLDADVTVLQNGEFMYYDQANGSVNCGKDGSAAGTVATLGEPMLVFNEIKLYEPFYRTTYKDFAMIRVGDNYVTSKLATEGYGDGATTQGATINPEHPDYGYRMDGIAPRLLKTNVGDIYTTNMVATGTGIEYAVGDTLNLKKTSRNTLELAANVASADKVSDITFVVAKVYTMPDGQPGLKIQRVQ